MSLRRKIRNSLKAASQRVFHVGQRFGVDITPRHFYSSIPDIRGLSETSAWRAPCTMVGMAGADIDSQLRFVQDCCPDSIRSKAGIDDLVAYGTQQNGQLGYGPLETAFLYCFIASKKPGRIVQVGAGYSTAIILRAAEEAGYPVQITAVDPFPTDFLRRLARSNRIRLVAEPAQETALNTLTDLGEGDLLFIDSTHTVKPGSEVNRLLLEVLPRLKKGTFVHFHDINFPYDYHRTVFSEPFFPQESILIHAFLIDNRRYAIAASLSMLHYSKPQELVKLFPDYRPAANNHGLEISRDGHFPSSLFLQVVE